MNMSIEHMLAGNSTFTVAKDKGEHRTFKVRVSGDLERFFVSVLTGADNKNSFTYLGMLVNKTKQNVTILQCIPTKKSTQTLQSPLMQIFNFGARILQGVQALPENYDILRSNKCCRCGRKLTTPESVKNGIGPECAGKAGLG